MALFGQFFEKLKRKAVLIPRERQSVHLNDLGHWVEEQQDALLAEAKLVDHSIHYAAQLREKRLLLESYLTQWNDKLKDLPNNAHREETRQLFGETAAFIELISLQDATLGKIVRLN